MSRATEQAALLAIHLEDCTHWAIVFPEWLCQLSQISHGKEGFAPGEESTKPQRLFLEWIRGSMEP
ncbi:hypothetical protein PHLCEN_2v13707 [Hermanssonia centrifuga]|uniref:Uncharacterized protein n=1 Tax=Hermanssonia centrifuga TaxID=98765 RepID=A0A2R6NDJ8_9APHY|nr:hypothetical protein PHLCEN_2v13707 [Hermanssonia centrifuga]